jgi:predicted DNA-binding protein (UPF0251 family)/predicted Fe-Mo cluster-binding NifX family protein
MKTTGNPRHELEEISMGLDEAEALRLADLEGLYQEAAARRMGVSRATFCRMIESARRKTADAVLNGKALRIEGGMAPIVREGERNMKIAAPSREGNIDEHFGHCKEYLVFSVNGKDITLEGTVPSPEGCGCKSNIASVLAAQGVTHMVAGNMGEGAVRVLGSNGITVIRGASGDVKRAVQAYVNGTLTDSGLGCAGHSGEAGHECSHS